MRRKEQGRAGGVSPLLPPSNRGLTPPARLAVALGMVVAVCAACDGVLVLPGGADTAAIAGTVALPSGPGFTAGMERLETAPLCSTCKPISRTFFFGRACTESVIR